VLPSPWHGAHRARSLTAHGFRATMPPAIVATGDPDMPTVTVTRRMTFNAAHRVHNPDLPDDENASLFGKCNNPNWHGHNYVLEISVEGEVDGHTGYVIDLGHVKRVVQESVIDRVDHRNMNLEVPFLHGINPTTENIVVAFWQVLEPRLRPARLTRLRLRETENHWAEYEGR
jgi:6-pyruvoyltetrahydropterin/6-carboxytetrahydropterin synthase